MAVALRRLLLGRPLPTAHAIHTRLPKRLALAVFSSDALSSTAYATEEILRVLMLYGLTAGAALPALHYAWPIALGIAVLLIIVSLSYRQTIFAYPGGASAYLVSKDNLGVIASLVAGAALLWSYILTVSVSVSAGAAAIVSAFPELQSQNVALCLFFIAFITLANLRGAKESGTVFAIPTYSFVFSMMFLLALGLFKLATGGVADSPPDAWTVETAKEAMLREHGGITQQLEAVSLFVILRAFASGCAALTGIEAISDGIPAFKKPEPRNAATTLMILATILTTMFLGMSYLATRMAIPAIPEDARGYETVISQLGRRVFTDGLGWYYYVLMASATAILVVGANTAYQDFPRLASLLARDKFLPTQLGHMGDRLVFANGILILAAFAALLVIVFRGSVTALLPLYAIGVFAAFTLSQGSMVRKWLRDRGQGWQVSLVMNLVGAIVTGIVMVVIGITKFNAGDPTGIVLPFGSHEGRPGTPIHYGAWLVIALVPLLVAMFRRINAHYADVARHLVPDTFSSLLQENNSVPVHHTVLVLVPGIHKGIFPALEYARSLSDDARAVYIEMDPANTPSLKEDWERHITGVPLIILESPLRSLTEPLVEYVEEVKDERADDVVTVILPELVSATRWWHRLLHNTSGKAIRQALGSREDIVVTNYRYFAEELNQRQSRAETGVEAA